MDATPVRLATYQPPPPPHSSTSVTSFPILAITILGMLTTVVLLLSYYLFVIKCRLSWHGSDLLLSSAQYRRHRHLYIPPIIHAITAEFRGLDPSIIRSISVVKFTRDGDDDTEQKTSSFNDCAICLNEFQEEERLKLLPNCSHAFHIDCIDTWLQFNAKCPLCRSEVTCTAHVSTDHIVVLAPRQERGEDIVIGVRDEVSNETPRAAAAAAPSPSRKKGRKFHEAGSAGDECIDVRAGKDEQFHVQPVRRSISMDSSNDRQLYLSVQEILRQNQHHFQEEGGGSGEGCSSGGGSSGRIRRPFFSFSWSSRSSTLPMKIDV